MKTHQKILGERECSSLFDGGGRCRFPINLFSLLCLSLQSLYYILSALDKIVQYRMSISISVHLWTLKIFLRILSMLFFLVHLITTYVYKMPNVLMYIIGLVLHICNDKNIFSSLYLFVSWPIEKSILM